jgi:hypothetical protein
LLRGFVVVGKATSVAHTLGLNRFLNLHSVPPIFKVVIKFALLRVVIKVIGDIDDIGFSPDRFIIVVMRTTEHVRLSLLLPPNRKVLLILVSFALNQLIGRRIRLIPSLCLFVHGDPLHGILLLNKLLLRNEAVG